MPRSKRERPNILLVLTDQVRADCLGSEGHPVLQTPYLDFFGRSGTRFRRAYSECPICIPARRTIMSGQDPQTHDMVGFADVVDWDPPHTLAGTLASAGYQCEMIGKLHLWPKRKRYGFHHIQLADSTRAEHNDYLLWLNGPHPLDRWAMAHGVSPNGWTARPSHLDETQTHAFWCITQAIDFLERRDPTCPFFLNVSLVDPHPPFSPPAYYFDYYARKDLPKPVIGDWAPEFEAPVRGLDPEGAEERSRIRIDDGNSSACHSW